MDNTKWYRPDTLEVLEMVPKKDGKGMTKVTLRQARPLGLLPSVTSVIDVLASHSLNDWIANQIIKTCISFPFEGEQTEASVDNYILQMKAKANEYAETTADKGKQIHADVNRWAEDNNVLPEDPVSKSIIGQIASRFKADGVATVRSEKSFGSKRLGFAGTPDLWTEGKFIKIWDLKTTDLSKFDKPYDKWMLQLGGYNLGTESAGAQIGQIVADRNTGEVMFLDYEDAERWENGFAHALELFFVVKGYDPRKEV